MKLKRSQVKKGLKQKDNICVVCGDEISETAAARVSHMRKHVRDGSLEENKGKDGKLTWKTTGKEPKIKREDPICWRTYHNKSISFDPRKPVAAKSNKKGEIFIKCRVCNKWIKEPTDFADSRFVAITCCDKISPFPKRMISTLATNPGKEYIE